MRTTVGTTLIRFRSPQREIVNATPSTIRRLLQLQLPATCWAMRWQLYTPFVADRTMYVDIHDD